MNAVWAPPPRLLWLLVGMVCALALAVPIMDVDAAQYASIAREMAETNGYLQVLHRGQPYLDKPPLLFWLAALCMEVLGPVGWAYKLPALAAYVLTIYASGRLARLLVGAAAGPLAAWLAATALAAVLMVNDVRADGLLAAAVVTAVWCLAEYTHRLRQPVRWAWLAAGWAAIGLGMLAKGPLGLVVPLMALGPWLLAQRRLVLVLRAKVWLVGLPVLALVLSPMLYGLHAQYGWRGWYFFFWEQSFGRITGENKWANQTDPFFFAHTLLWSVLPWVPLLLGALWACIRHRKALKPAEWLALAGLVLPLVALSFSRYKLPHYLNVALPFAALLVAATVVRGWLGARWAQATAWLALVLLALALALSLWAFWPDGWPAWAVVAGAVLVAVWAGWRLPGAWARACALSVCTWAVLMGVFYPGLLRYQAGHQLAARYNAIYPGCPPHIPLATLRYRYHAFAFYARGHWQALGNPPDAMRALTTQADSVWVMGQPADVDTLELAGYSPVPGHTYTVMNYPVTRLKWSFLNPATRTAHVRPLMLALLWRPGASDLQLRVNY